jgi:hypothetical protein
LGIAALAHGKYFLFFGGGTVEDLQAGLRTMQLALDEFAEDIQAVQALSASLYAAGRALGLSNDEAERRLHAKLCREFFELPGAARDIERGHHGRHLGARPSQRLRGGSVDGDFRQSLRLLRECVAALGLQSAIHVHIR